MPYFRFRARATNTLTNSAAATSAARTKPPQGGMSPWAMNL